MTRTPRSVRNLKLKESEKLVEQLMAIPGGSGDESAVAAFITRHLVEAGAPKSAIRHDTAHRHSRLGGAVGNLMLKLPGTPGRTREPRRLLMAHMDTVPLCVGGKPVRKGARYLSGDPKKAIGADDRAGVAVVLTAALHLLRRGLPHPPVTFMWCVQEEVGLLGARHADLKKLGSPAMAFNFDGGSASRVVVGATGAYRMFIDIHGRASHAGHRPEDGISALTIAGLAIADLYRGRWLGLVQRRGSHPGVGTSNVGVVRGGHATNVTTDFVHVRAEARSHDPGFRKQIVEAYRTAFEHAVMAVRNVAGDTGRMEFQAQQDYEAFRLPPDAPCVAEAERVIRSLGQTPERTVVNAGLDANWMNAHGIPTVTIGAGQENPHTVNESLNVHEFHQSCQAAVLLAVGESPESE